uniref:acetyl-CoA carboxylase n=1 Tax=Caenorhabditis tropicalis TaxID=1561998 RepID=A0A1I7T0B6_9PELO
MSDLGEENCSDPPINRIDEFVRQFEKGRSIKRVLIANNGLAAMKCLISIRQWLQNQFDTSDIVTLICIATEDEMKSASHYLKLADEIIMAPSGANSKNFANVEVITRLAIESRADAVYVGWGHASENPELCRRLRKNNIIFIGPSEKSIIASGDKIISTIIAQSIGMPTVTWSGSDVKVKECVDFEHFHELRAQATIKTAKEGFEAIKKYQIGVPMMIKASEGGGGKGIRKCERMEDFEKLFKDVEMEVPNSPIFLMKCMEGARHVEIQIVGDQHGEVVALSSRDCTIQRRCQKVIEEAPATIVPEDVMRNMKRDAIAFANFVDYYSAGTVELLFVPSTSQYFFLELNPRLQVEHPCTESICDVNVPSLQFQIAMGRKLKDIPSIKRFKDKELRGENGKIHCMAARVTCEDPNDRFLPSTGTVKSLKFNSTSKAWAYFSLTDGSTVHEFADSQIGHVFARGRDRSEAIANLKHALNNLKIDATFPTQSAYLIDLLSLEKFKSNQYDTQWLDQRIARREGQRHTLPIEHLIAVSAAAIGRSKIRKSFEIYENHLKTGKILLPVELSRSAEAELQINNIKFSVKVFEETQFKYQLRLGDQETTVEMLKYGSHNLAIHQGKSMDYSLEETNDYYSIKISGNKLKFSKTDNNDVTCLRSPYTGKFLEYKVQPGEFVQVGQTYAQIESMKMVFDVVTKVAPGRLIPIAKEGDLISPGSLLGRLEIDKHIQDQLTTSEKFTGKMNEWRVKEKTDFEKAKLIMEGRGSMDYSIDNLIRNLFSEYSDERGDDVSSSNSEIVQLLEIFLDTERYFDARDGFDESVQDMLHENPSFGDVVDKIHSNTHLKVKERLVVGILETLSAESEISEDLKVILQKMFNMKQLKTISPLAAKILYRISENQEFSVENCRIDILKSTFSNDVASMRFRSATSSSETEFSEKVHEALVEFACVSTEHKNIKFVSNRIEISIFDSDFLISDLEGIILDEQKRLEEAEVREIIIYETSKKWRFSNDIGVFFCEQLDASVDFTAPQKRDLKRSLARQNRTTYIYDFPIIFASVASGSTSPEDWISRIQIQELVVNENHQLEAISDPEELERRATNSLNTCSVVAWLVNLEIKIGCNQEFVLIGNDVTHQVGSFAQPEHRLFEMASKLAREKKIPRINISCNSGARIGLARDVLDILKVKLKPNGHDFDYVYVDSSEKERLGDQIVYEEHGDELKLVAVKGKKDEYIGVENLMGSGAIGGETSRAYREIPTYCYVTGRSVGIGAYTARLARRIIQHEKSHLILTGATALNTLLGKKVYASNNRLGGIEIMSNNGIAHATVSSDIEGVRKLVHWLQYLPVKQTEFPFFKCLKNPSPWRLEEVDVTKEEMHLDVRNIIVKAGKQGIFDTGSFDEIRTSWAASIVTGRAKLNGMPVGVIASQWKLFEKRQLADESVDNGEETTVTRAGQVWYPDSAFKTSQAISDFNRESIPLVMIASLRGFSGGRKDMSDQVLTFGAHIIDELSQYQQPVIIYIPAGGELRGGAWAVVDSNVNRGFVHVIADESCRGGILEPNAIVGIKIRDAQIGKIMERSGVSRGAEDSVKSAFKKACVEFADMHDRWQRMEYIGAIRQVTSLSETREVFWRILRHEMILIEISNKYRNAPIFPKPTRSEALEWIQSKIGDNQDLQNYYENCFHNDVTREIQESKQRFEELCATWQN